ncbi:MAG: UDP-3-O-(3-hydroxymyristoyl)glucosamine N-acyltransferase [Oceanicaulis sp.]
MGADARFFERLGPHSAGELAALAGGELFGDAAAPVSDVAEPASAKAGELYFLTKSPEQSRKGAVAIVKDASAVDLLGDNAAVIVAADPRAAFGRACAALLKPRVHDGAEFVHRDAIVDPAAQLGPGVVVGQGARIGASVVLGPGAVIGPGVELGEGTVVGARAVIGFAVIGKRCEIAAGVIIGEAGFGLAHDSRGLFSMPHVGRVMIGDEVTLGANTTVDRGMIADTRLGTGCRIDNLCHIAHNVSFGEYAVMAAFGGVSGSVEVGAGAQFGGRAGVADHVRIGNGAKLAAFAGVMRDVPDGETWAGSPAQPIQRFMRETVWIRRQAGKKSKGGDEKDRK